MNAVKLALRRILPQRLQDVIRVVLRGLPKPTSGCAYFDYDKERFYAYAGCCGGGGSREGVRARIIADYHVLEKGFTMPNRHVPFGIEVSKRLLDGIETFERRFGVDDLQVRYAVGLLKAYYALHEQTALSSLDEFWPRLKQCVEKHNDVPAAEEPHFSFVDFYAKNEMPFPIFAASRHTVRNYTDKDIPITDIEKAVSVAMTAPSACNRQHCKVYCISDRDKINAVCEVQSGARGFGHLSNKLLVVVANVEDAVWLGERHDLYVNGGMFLMNLCYALHYQKIAHCILTWARGPSEDSRLRELLPIRDSESIVALLTCGIAPEEFDIAASPRKMVKECFEAI